MNDLALPHESATKITVYESAIDRWVVALLLLSPLTGASLGVYCFVDGKADGAAILLVAAAATLLISVALTLPCRYTLTKDAISIRCGIFVFHQLRYSDIESVQRSSSWRSGPALSLDRIEITTNKKSVIVSPTERDRFVTDLTQRIDGACQ